VALYQLSRQGYHTPLSAEQIAELFHGGRIGRDDLCKKSSASQWQTIDELFPLLKYDSVSRFGRRIGASRRRVTDFVILGILFGIVATVFLWLYVSWPVGNDRPGSTATPIRMVARPSSTSRAYSSNVVSQIGRTNTPASLNETDDSTVAQSAENEQHRAEQQQEQAAVAEQTRAAQEQESATRKRAEGTDVLCPLDQTIMVDAGGSPVTVKIHDNDVTTFDAWVNGSHMREVQKNKGISHTRTDETLIYRNNRAALYYVWEISGELNHCLLRVREN
jgi:hypothetical protein